MARPKYQGFDLTRTKGGVLIENFRPRGGVGIATRIRYASKLDPEAIKLWRPTARLAAMLSIRIRDRVRKEQRGPTGSRFGPGAISGKMWQSLTTSVTARKASRARVYVAGSSASFIKTKRGVDRRRTSYGTLPPKVKNELKAKAVSGLGMVPPRDSQGRLIRQGGSVERYGQALVPVGFEPPRHQSGWFKKWPAKARRGLIKLVPQKFASGKHRPVSALLPSKAEIDAALSVFALGLEKLAHKGGVPNSKLRGDPKLISLLRRGLGV